MMNTFSNVTHQSYGSRLGGSCKTMALGPIFLIIGIWLLISNEGSFVRQQRTLSQGLKHVVEISPNGGIDSKKDGKLIHIVGTAEPRTNLVDPKFGVSPSPSMSAIRLFREVHMFQWVEKREGTTHIYNQQWRMELINSNAFAYPDEHVNPTSMRFDQLHLDSKDVRLGDYYLTEDVVDQMTGDKWFKLLTQPMHVANITDPKTKQDAVVYGDGFYFASTKGSDPAYPVVGDIRVLFSYVPKQTISIIACQRSDTFAPYITDSGETILMIEPGVHTAEEMFLRKEKQVKRNAWGMRVLGYLSLVLAFKLAVEPISTLTEVVPLLGDLIETGSGIFAVTSATIVSIVVIGFSWLFFRPLVSLLLFGLVGGAAYYWQDHKKGNASVSGGGYGMGGAAPWTYDLVNSSSV